MTYICDENKNIIKTIYSLNLKEDDILRNYPLNYSTKEVK